ncbi:hypothetical protein D1AOALGA4SA_5213 [Olavius algarvensis Delta 1 endosymbiont]|nr:hypothetical protein D1AOALGA4SA_5213 [Olavius algarvensis Delta 1 endosymbiont]
MFVKQLAVDLKTVLMAHLLYGTNRIAKCMYSLIIDTFFGSPFVHRGGR